MTTYAGIGSRQTPPGVLAEMQDLAHAFALQGFTLRSGAADGADAAFEAGAHRGRGRSEIYLPWRGFNGHSSGLFGVTDAARKLAASVHPRWSSLSQGAQSLHARSCYQILGRHLDAPCAFVCCWTPDACEGWAGRTRETGGTATGIVLAERCRIPVFNLQAPRARERLSAWLDEFVRTN